MRGSHQRRTEHQRGADAQIVPVGTDAAQRAGADDLVMLDVEVIDRAGVAVAHDHVALAGIAADIAKAESLPLHSDRAELARIYGVKPVVLDVEEIKRAVVDVVDN